MIITENIIIGNRDCVRTYSDKGMYIERDGIRYEEAIDYVELGREYTETNELIPERELSIEEALEMIKELREG
jgi:hypothetical protein